MRLRSARCGGLEKSARRATMWTGLSGTGRTDAKGGRVVEEADPSAEYLPRPFLQRIEAARGGALDGAGTAPCPRNGPKCPRNRPVSAPESRFPGRYGRTGTLGAVRVPVSQNGL